MKKGLLLNWTPAPRPPIPSAPYGEDPSAMFFPPPPPQLSPVQPTQVVASPPTRWRIYWALLTWYLTQGGRVAVSMGIASFVWFLFALFPGALAWLLTLVTLMLIGQFDVHLVHTKQQ